MIYWLLYPSCRRVISSNVISWRSCQRSASAGEEIFHEVVMQERNALLQACNKLFLTGFARIYESARYNEELEQRLETQHMSLPTILIANTA